MPQGRILEPCKLILNPTKKNTLLVIFIHMHDRLINVLVVIVSYYEFNTGVPQNKILEPLRYTTQLVVLTRKNTIHWYFYPYA